MEKLIRLRRLALRITRSKTFVMKICEKKKTHLCLYPHFQIVIFGRFIIIFILNSLISTI